MIVIIHNLNMRGLGLRLEDCKFLGILGKACLKIRAYWGCGWVVLRFLTLQTLGSVTSIRKRITHKWCVKIKSWSFLVHSTITGHAWWRDIEKKEEKPKILWVLLTTSVQKQNQWRMIVHDAREGCPEWGWLYNLLIGFEICFYFIFSSQFSLLKVLK